MPNRRTGERDGVEPISHPFVRDAGEEDGSGPGGMVNKASGREPGLVKCPRAMGRAGAEAMARRSAEASVRCSG
jgi:hypothetical protein